MLYQPEAHERLTARWNEERVRDAVRSITAETEDAFDDGWDTPPSHPVLGRRRDRRRTASACGGRARRAAPGLLLVSRALARRGADFPDENPRGSLFFGEVGIRLVLQRLAPSAENLDELAARIEENARDERRELMWGSPGTMLVARELGFDDLWAESAEWLIGERDADGLWEQNLFGTRVRYLGPAHGFAGCVLALGEDPLANEVARRHAVEQDGLANWPPAAGDALVSPRDGSIRTQWCHGASGMVTSLGDLLDEDLALAAGELVGCGAACEGREPLPRDRRQRLRVPDALRAYGRRAVARARPCLRDARDRAGRAHAFAHGRYNYSLWSGDLDRALSRRRTRGGGAIPLP